MQSTREFLSSFMNLCQHHQSGEQQESGDTARKEGVRGAKMRQVYGGVTLDFHRFLKFGSRSCSEPKSCALETPQTPQASRHGLGTAPHPCLPQAEGALVVLTELP